MVEIKYTSGETTEAVSLREAIKIRVEVAITTRLLSPQGKRSDGESF